MLTASVCLAVFFGLVWLGQASDAPLDGAAELAAGFLGALTAGGVALVLLACLMFAG